jgi:hypothetical protein
MNLKIDLTNPEEVASKMPEIRALYEQKLQEQRALNMQVELLRRLVDSVGAPSMPQGQQLQGQPPRRRRAAPAQDRAVQALEHASKALGGTALGPTSLHKFMDEHGMEPPKNASLLGTNLWDAWRAGRVMKAPNGVYTPLDGTGRTEWDRPLTDYYFADEQGLPTP